MPFIFPASDEVQRQLPFHLDTIGYDWPQEPIKRPDGYPHYQWIHSISGTGLLTVGGRTETVPPGHGFFLMPDEAHDYGSAGGEWITDWMGFSGFAVPEVLHFVGLAESGVHEISEFWRLKTIMREAYTAAIQDSAIAFQETSLIVYELLLALRTAREAPTRNAEPRHHKVRPVLQYIRTHYMTNLTIDELSSVIDVTPQYLCQIFRQSLSMRPFEYLSSYRIARAKELLVLRPQMSIAEVARLTGFSDSNYFCRVFKKGESISPGVFRSLHCPVPSDDMKI